MSEGKHAVNVMGRERIPISHPSLSDCILTKIAAAAEKALEITRSLIDLAKIESGLSKPLTVYVVPPRYLAAFLIVICL